MRNWVSVGWGLRLLSIDGFLFSSVGFTVESIAAFLTMKM